MTHKKNKNLVAAILLTFFLGPIGLFYASIWGGLILTLGPIGYFTLEAMNEGYVGQQLFVKSFAYVFAYGIMGFVIYWPFSIAWAAIAVTMQNKKNNREIEEYEELIAMYPNTDQSSISQTDHQMFEWLKQNPNKTIQDYYRK